MNFNAYSDLEDNEFYNDYKIKKEAYDKLDKSLAMRVAMKMLVNSSVNIESGRQKLELAKKEMELAKERLERSQQTK